VLEIAAIVGCLNQGSAGTWVVTHGSDPVVSKTQSTSSADLKVAATIALGEQRYELLGASPFSPSSDKGLKVAVKGVLIKNSAENRLNVTSLQMLGSTCQ
jgi:hypothetical protein